MADVGGFITGLLNTFSPTNLVDSVVGAFTGDNADLKNNPNPGFADRVGSAIGNSQIGQDLAGATKAVTNAPIVGAPLKFVLDLPNQTFDSFMNGVQTGTGDDPNLSFVDGWRQSWDTYGQANHVSGGDILGADIAGITGAADAGQVLGANPLTKQGVDTLKAAAHKTWYGDVAGAVSDLAAGFENPVGLLGSVAKDSREASILSTKADVDAVAEGFNKNLGDGTLDSLPKGSAAITGHLSTDNQVARFGAFVDDTLAHAQTPTDAINHLAPRMEGATENAKNLLAEIASVAATLPKDTGRHVLGNAMLGLMGSDAAKAETLSANSLIFSKIAEASGPPSHLDRVAQAQGLVAQAFAAGGPIDTAAISKLVFNTPARQAAIDGISQSLEQATADAAKAQDFRSRMLSLKPSFRQKVDGQMVDTNFDTARLREARDNAVQQHEQLKAELASAQADLKGSTRWSGAADKTDTSFNKASFNQATGAAQQRVDDLTQRVAEAAADRKLLEQTPLNDPDAMAQWQQQMTAARAGTKDAMAKRNLLDATLRVAKRSLADDMKTATAMQPALSATHDWLAKIDTIGSPDVMWTDANTSSTLLSQAKTALRDHIGRTYLYDAGDRSPRTFFHIHPKETFDSFVANIGTQYGRSAVNVADRFRGQQQLGMYMKKSGVFNGDEIKAATDKFITLDRQTVGSHLEDVQDEMLSRIGQEYNLSPATLRKIVSESRGAMNSSRSYLTDATDAAERDQSRWAKVSEQAFGDDSSDALHMLDAPFLRSHLTDTVPFSDPLRVREMLERAKGMTSNLEKFLNTVDGTIHVANSVWKMTNLLRPGLFFRNMLDTGLRSLALMGATGSLMAAQNGTRNALRNLDVRAADFAIRGSHKLPGDPLERIGLTLSPEDTVKQTMANNTVKIATGKGKTAEVALYEQKDGVATAASLAGNHIAMTRAASPHDVLLDQTNALHGRFLTDKRQWDMYEPDHPRWSVAYGEHAQVMLGSPLVRKLAEMDDLPAEEALTGPALLDRLFSDPAVKTEYQAAASKLGMDRQTWVSQTLHEMDTMFPVDGMASDLLKGKLAGRAGKAWIEENFPQPLRFRVPGFESHLEAVGGRGSTIFDWGMKTAEKAFRVLMDNPDFWIVRHPVALKTFGDQVKLEAQKLLDARIARDGEDAELTQADINKITARARTKAITTVRNYGFDTTANTAFSQSVHRLAPFYGVYADVMRAYSKLIYDDPRRLGMLTGLYNAPTNLSEHLPQPLTVDVNGNPVAPGQVPTEGGGEAYIVLNSLLGGRKPFGTDLRLRRSSFNAILMGEVPWLPGWGPSVAVPARIIANELPSQALAAANSDNPIVQTAMKSLWPDGQIPKGASPADILGSLTPPVWKHVVDGYTGETFYKNVQYNMNQQYIDAMRTGQKFDPTAAYQKAQEAARNANTVLLISQGIFGISGQSQVQGQFYVNQMHQLMGLTPGQVKAMGYPSVQAAFSSMFPEAASLDWSFTKNTTGIAATYQAQQDAFGLKSLIDKQPDLGWFIIGADNVGGQFSQTAYNQQQNFKYGMTGSEGRQVLSPGDVMKNTMSGYGWDQFTKFTTQLDQLAQQFNYPPHVVAQIKAQYVQQLGAENPTWFSDYSDRQNKIADFYNEADLLAKDPKLAGRQDIGMYVQYRQAMTQVMDTYNLNNLSGTGQKAAEARAALNAVGTQLARQNIGFQQMWERMLYNDVKPRPSDARYGYVDTTNAQPAAS